MIIFVNVRATVPAIMLCTMIGFYVPSVQAQGDTPVEAVTDHRAERAREQAADEAREQSSPVPVVEAEPVFERSLAQVTRNDPDAEDTRLPTRLPQRLPIRDDSGNTAFFEVEVAPDTRAVEREWIMLIRTSQRSALEEQAPELMDYLTGSQPFEAIGSEILIFRVPPALDADNAILELVPSDMRNLIDRNHIYSVEADETESEEETSEADSAKLDGSELKTPLNPVCEDTLGIGIIDSTISRDHPAFDDMARRGTDIISRDFIDDALELPKGHGTAVAGLLTGKSDGLSPLLPGATLYNAGVVYSRDTFHKGATARHLLQALDWLMTQDVQVINMSLAGPPNRLLSQGIEAAVNSGRFVVAAVGNEGPHAPPQFPAAYEFVISATAVDRQRNIYRWANQGEYMDFAALGVSVATARGDGTIGKESGTSMAAPVVSAFLACALIRHRRNVPAALNELKTSVSDLGEPGYDTVFGHGLLHP